MGTHAISNPYRSAICQFSSDTWGDNHALITQGFVSMAINSPGHCHTHICLLNTHTQSHTHSQRSALSMTKQPFEISKSIKKQKFKKQRQGQDEGRGGPHSGKPTSRKTGGQTTPATQQHHTPIQRAESHERCLTGEIKKGDKSRRWQLPFFFSRPARIQKECACYREINERAIQRQRGRGKEGLKGSYLQNDDPGEHFY